MKPRTLREAWFTVTADDYDCHMAAIGQARANAEIVRELFHARPPASGAAVLVAGGGTGQMFDFVTPDFLRPFALTFTDINPEYLRRLQARLDACPGLNARTALDDIESSALSGEFALLVAVLVLEHVDALRAIATMCRLAARVFVVVQENPPRFASAVTREPVGSVAVFCEVEPHLHAAAEIERQFAAHGFHRVWTISREVLDDKQMVGMEFSRAGS